MWARLPVASRRRAVWLANEGIESLLEDLNSDGFATSQIFVPRGMAGNQTSLLKGAPLISIEQAPALGQRGDLVLADLSWYTLIDTGLRSAISADCKFVEGKIVFRFVLRVDGQPALSAPVTPFDGSVTKSPFV